MSGLLPDLRRETLSFIITEWSELWIFHRLRMFLYNILGWEFFPFVTIGCWILSKVFSLFVKTTMWPFFLFCYMICFIIWFLILYQASISVISPIWCWCITLFMCCLIQPTNILLKVFFFSSCDFFLGGGCSMGLKLISGNTSLKAWVGKYLSFYILKEFMKN